MQAELRKHGELKATPVKNKEAAGMADFLHRAHRFVSEPFGYKNPPGELISEMLGVPAVARTLERVGYGAPLTTGAGMTTKPRADTAEAALAVAPLAQVTRGLPVGAAIKPKGGNWIKGSIEKSTAPLKPRGPAHRDEALMLGGEWDALKDTFEGQAVINRNAALSDWFDKKLNRYIQNEMATPDDPVLKAGEKFLKEEKPKLLAAKEKQLAKARADLEKAQRERGVNPEVLTRSQARVRELEKELTILEARTGFHADIGQTYSVSIPDIYKERRAAGLPEQGFATTELGRNWQNAADQAISSYSPEQWTKSNFGADRIRAENPWLATVDPSTRVYTTNQGTLQGNLSGQAGFQHLADELVNATNPSSGLPKELLIDPAKLQKMSVPDVVRHIDMINAWRAGQKAEADLARAGNVATHTFKEYPEKGLKWVELKAPKNAEPIDDGFGNMSSPGWEELEDALKYEGEMLQHCVGGYCPDVYEGRSRIFSLRDDRGRPHATIEVKPGLKIDRSPEDLANWLETPEGKAIVDKHPEAIEDFMVGDNTKLQQVAPGLFNRPPEIVQVKGARNAAPGEKYQPYIQDFVKSQKWGRVGDLENTGLQRGADLLNDTLNPLFNRAREIVLEQRPGLSVSKDEMRKMLEGKYYASPEEVASDILGALPAPSTPPQPFWANLQTGQVAPFEAAGMHNKVIQDPEYAARLGVTPETAFNPDQPLMMGRLDPQNQEVLNLMQTGQLTAEQLPLIQKLLQAQTSPHKRVSLSAGENLFENIPADELLKLQAMEGLEPYRKYKDGGSAKKEDVPTPWLFSVPTYAETVAYEMYPGQRGQDDRQDAARHMLAAGTLARKYGPNVAGFLAKAHEYKTSPLKAIGTLFGGSMPPDFEMDMHNNQVGIDAAAKAQDQADLERIINQMAEQASKFRTPGLPYIKKAEGGTVDIPDDFTAPDMSDGGRALPDPDYMRLALQQSR